MMETILAHAQGLIYTYQFDESFINEIQLCVYWLYSMYVLSPSLNIKVNLPVLSRFLNKYPWPIPPGHPRQRTSGCFGAGACLHRPLDGDLSQVIIDLTTLEKMWKFKAPGGGVGTGLSQ